MDTSGITLTRNDVRSVSIRAEALLDAGRADEAMVLLSAAQQAHPGSAALLLLTGRSLLAQGGVESAIGALFMAVELEPDNANVHHALGILLFNRGELDHALTHGIQAFERAPTAEHATALGAVLIGLGRYQQAQTVLGHALTLAPAHWEALANRALALQGLGRFEQGLTAARRAAEIAPTNAGARYNLGCALLAMGRMTPEAWNLFEWRLRLDGNPAWVAATAQHRWNGEDIADRTILLHAEQGFGDTIQFVRYAPWVAERAGRVILAVQPPLARLLRDVPGIDDVVVAGEALPPFDVICPLLSLPRIFGTTLETIPPGLPWTVPAPAPQDTLRVGLAWCGSKTFRDDRQRSLAPADLSRLAAIPGVQFTSLQKHEADEGHLSSSLEMLDPMAGVTDFRETAAIIAGLDLVIAVDTAVAHLAATLGKPVWLLARWRGCWRWMHHRGDSPWYPTIRVFRQSAPNDWAGPLDAIRLELTRRRPPVRPASER